MTTTTDRIVFDALRAIYRALDGIILHPARREACGDLSDCIDDLREMIETPAEKTEDIPAVEDPDIENVRKVRLEISENIYKCLLRDLAVTPAMAKAGGDVIRGNQPIRDDEDEVATLVFKAMHKVMRSPTPPEDGS